MARFVRVFATAPLALVLLASAAVAQDPPLRHPFRGVAPVEGPIPLLDVKDSPAGKRYAVLDQGGQRSEDAEVERRSGVVEVEHLPIPARERAAAARAKASEGPLTRDLSPRSAIGPRLAAAIAGERARAAKGEGPRFPVEIHLRRP